MKTFEFNAPTTIGNCREEVEPLLDEYRSAFFELGRDGIDVGVQNRLSIARINLEEMLCAAVRMGDDDVMTGAVIQFQPYAGRTFNGRGFWRTHISERRDVRMTSTSTPQKIAKCAITVGSELLEEAERGQFSYGAIDGHNASYLLGYLFRSLQLMVQQRGWPEVVPAPGDQDWLITAAEGKLADSRFSVLDGLIEVDDLSFFTAEDYDVLGAQAGSVLYVPSPRASGKPTIRGIAQSFGGPFVHYTPEEQMSSWTPLQKSP